MKLYPKKSRKPLRAIRYFCFECMGWDRRSQNYKKPIDDVAKCVDEMCPLYDFRFGKNPFLKGRTKGNPEALKRWQDKAKRERESISTGE